MTKIRSNKSAKRRRKHVSEQSEHSISSENENPISTLISQANKTLGLFDQNFSAMEGHLEGYAMGEEVAPEKQPAWV